LKATEVCTSNGKKTLNVDHIIEALKLINFDSHIKKLQAELDLTALQNEDSNSLSKKESIPIIDDSMGMKDLINKKRKNKKEKKTFEFTEDLLNEQMELFEKSKMENMQNYLYEGISYNNIAATSGRVVSNGEAFLLDNNKKMKLDIIEQDLFTKKERTNSQEEINFD
jgi:hypothetical protein